MKYFPASRAHWTMGKGYRKKVLLEEDELGIPGSFIQMVEFKPGDKVPLHHHEKTKEVFIALDQAAFVINGKVQTLEPTDVLICEPGDIHGNPVIESPFRVLVIKVGYQADDTIWRE